MLWRRPKAWDSPNPYPRRQTVGTDLRREDISEAQDGSVMEDVAQAGLFTDLYGKHEGDHVTAFGQYNDMLGAEASVSSGIEEMDQMFGGQHATANAAALYGARLQGTGGVDVGFGPRIGAIDPDTGERQRLGNVGYEGMYDLGASVAYDAGANASASWLQGVEADAQTGGEVFGGLQGRHQASVGLAAGGVPLAGLRGETEGTAGGWATAEAGAHAGLGWTGLDLGADAAFEAKAGVEGGGNVGIDFLGSEHTYGLNGFAGALADAYAHGHVESGPTGGAIGGSIEAHADLEADVSANYDWDFLGADFVDLNGYGGVSAGIGGNAGIDLGFHEGVLDFQIDLGLCPGVGVLGGLGGSLDLKAVPAGILNVLDANGVDVDGFGERTWDKVTHIAGGIGNAAGGAIDAIGGLFAAGKERRQQRRERRGRR